MTFDPQYYLTWRADGELPGRRGAYGYQDAHPLAFRRSVPTSDYLRERLDSLVRAVPGARELHPGRSSPGRYPRRDHAG